MYSYILYRRCNNVNNNSSAAIFDNQEQKYHTVLPIHWNKTNVYKIIVILL